MNAPRFSIPENSRFVTVDRIRNYLDGQVPTGSTPPRPRVGLALGGGGAKGTFHVGVFKALAELGIHVDVVSGTSMGALIGAYYCAGLSPDQISQQLIDDFQVNRIWKWIPFGTYFRMATLLRQGHVQRCMQRNVEFQKVEDLPKKFVATATDLVSGESVHINQGCLPTAVAASIGIPGLTRPLEHDDRLLADGGILENVPVAAARAAGADIVIAVDVAEFSEDVSNRYVKTARGSLGRALSAQFKRLTDKQLEQADIVIRPDTTSVNFINVHHCPFKTADIGQQAAEKVLAGQLAKLNPVNSI